MGRGEREKEEHMIFFANFICFREFYLLSRNYCIATVFVKPFLRKNDVFLLFCILDTSKSPCYRCNCPSIICVAARNPSWTYENRLSARRFRSPYRSTSCTRRLCKWHFGVPKPKNAWYVYSFLILVIFSKFLFYFEIFIFHSNVWSKCTLNSRHLKSALLNFI